MDLKVAEIVDTPEGQLIRLPKEFRFHSTSVSIRRVGSTLVLEPVKPTTWPEGFWEKVRIDDPNFERPDQGEMPPAPVFD